MEGDAAEERGGGGRSENGQRKRAIDANITEAGGRTCSDSSGASGAAEGNLSCVTALCFIRVFPRRRGGSENSKLHFLTL